MELNDAHIDELLKQLTKRLVERMRNEELID